MLRNQLYKCKITQSVETYIVAIDVDKAKQTAVTEIEEIFLDAFGDNTVTVLCERVTDINQIPKSDRNTRPYYNMEFVTEDFAGDQPVAVYV